MLTATKFDEAPICRDQTERPLTGILAAVINPLLARSALLRTTRRSPVAFFGLVLTICVASSCQNDAAIASASSTSSIPAGTGSRSLTPAGGSVTGLGVACTYTDPGATSISVGRALTCPDGTSVWVRGVVMTKADGTRWICDEDASSSANECAEKGLQVIGGDGFPAGTQLIGIKSGATLNVQPRLDTFPSFVPIPLDLAPPTT